MNKRVLKEYKSDLHIHTCLSPCGDWGMSPKTIILESLKKGLDIIGICDHNSVENVEAVIKAGENCEIKILPGVEVCSSEEAHILVFFDEMDNAFLMQDHIYKNLMGENNPEIFGYQVVSNCNDEVINENNKLLIGATTLSVEDIINKATTLKGMCIASHVDRQSFSIISQLGFIPEKLNLAGVEISKRITVEEAKATISGIERFNCIRSSDAHYPEEIGEAYTVFYLEKPVTQEIIQALKNEKNRKIVRYY